MGKECVDLFATLSGCFCIVWSHMSCLMSRIDVHVIFGCVHKEVCWPSVCRSVCPLIRHTGVKFKEMVLEQKIIAVGTRNCAIKRTRAESQNA